MDWTILASDLNGSGAATYVRWLKAQCLFQRAVSLSLCSTAKLIYAPAAKMMISDVPRLRVFVAIQAKEKAVSTSRPQIHKVTSLSQEVYYGTFVGPFFQLAVLFIMSTAHFLDAIDNPYMRSLYKSVNCSLDVVS